MRRMFENSHGHIKTNRCEWCSNGSNEHNWPENRRRHVPAKLFKLSTSNRSHRLLAPIQKKIETPKRPNTSTKIKAKFNISWMKRSVATKEGSSEGRGAMLNTTQSLAQLPTSIEISEVDKSSFRM